MRFLAWAVSSGGWPDCGGGLFWLGSPSPLLAPCCDCCGGCGLPSPLDLPWPALWLPLASPCFLSPAWPPLASPFLPSPGLPPALPSPFLPSPPLPESLPSPFLPSPLPPSLVSPLEGLASPPWPPLTPSFLRMSSVLRVAFFWAPLA